MNISICPAENKHINCPWCLTTLCHLSAFYSGYVRCEKADVEDYGNKWTLSALLRYLRSVEGWASSSTKWTAPNQCKFWLFGRQPLDFCLPLWKEKQSSFKITRKESKPSRILTYFLSASTIAVALSIKSKIFKIILQLSKLWMCIYTSSLLLRIGISLIVNEYLKAFRQLG